MQIFWLILFGFLSGIVGGMGMGGGTLLAPLLSFLDIPQRAVQGINLVSFVPMCVMALVLHFKNKLVKTRSVGWIALPAVVFSVVGALLAGNTSHKVLRMAFGGFLVAVGVWQVIVAVNAAVRCKKSLCVVYCANGKLRCKSFDKKKQKS